MRRIPIVRAIKIQIMRTTSFEIYLGMFQRSTSTQNVYTAIACSIPIRQKGVSGEVAGSTDQRPAIEALIVRNRMTCAMENVRQSHPIAAK